LLIVRDAKKEEWEDIMALAWRTYLKFEAGEYPTEGTTSFFAFITNATLYQMFLKGEYLIKIAKIDKKIVGMISMRNKNHLSLLFVEKEYHRQGIGKKLVDAMCMELKKSKLKNCITVNAAPYALEFYHEIGFFDLSGQIENEGIIYVSMQRNIK
jgi:predicted GNAT family N-acyltransferase